MSSLFTRKRHYYRLPGFFLSLIAVLFFSGKVNPQEIPGYTDLNIAQKSVKIEAVKTPDEISKNYPEQLLTKGVKKSFLDNGLTVLTKEVHSSPVVTVQVWYKIGSRNEEPGLNGIAHQLEHMVFKGTNSRPIQFGRLFSALGSDSNAFTSYDETAYFGTVERDKLKAMLILEADRMQNSVINPQSLASEKRVVISELQGYENSPSYRLARAVMRSAIPNHPYGLMVGGTKADVEKFSVEKVREYYRKYYTPDNATLIIVGDFQTEETLKTVKEIFGKLPKSQQLDARLQTTENPIQKTENKNETTSKYQFPKIETKSHNAKSKIILQEPGSTALLQTIYLLPDINHPDIPALDVMDYILTGGRTSRIYQALVESGLASNAGGYTNNLIEGGWYEMSATAAAGQSLNKIDEVLQQTINTLQREGVSAEEINRAKAKLQARMILDNRDITSQAMLLGNNEIIAGDYRYSDRYLAAINKVTAADVQRVAKIYLNPELRTTGFFQPTKIDNSSEDSDPNYKQTSDRFNQGVSIDDAAEVNKYLPPLDNSNQANTNQQLPEKFTLTNGLRVLLLRDTSTPTVTLSGYIRAGTEFDPANKSGLANLTAQNLMNGTTTKDALTITKTLDDRGASLSFHANREGIIIQGNSLAADLPTLIQTLSDVLKTANFPPEKLELTRQKALTELKVELDDPASLARRIFQQSIYPKNHPFHSFSSESSLKEISRQDIINFYRQNYRPDLTVLTLVGDFDPVTIKNLLETQFSNWKATGKTPDINYPTVSLPKAVIQLYQVIPGKSQSVTYLGNPGINRQDKRYYSALVLNQILGGDTLASRLGTEIRDRLGLTYGIYSYFQAGQYSGPFIIQMQTAPEDTEKAIASTLKLLTEIHSQGVTEVEIKAARNSLKSSYTVNLADIQSLARTILMNEVYGLDREHLRDYPQQIEKVTPAQVIQAAKELLHPGNIVVVTAGPPVSAAK